MPALAVPQLGSCAFSGRARRLWLVWHSQGEAQPLGALPPPRVLERTASKAADSTAVDHVGATLGKTSAMDALARSVQQQAQESGLLEPVPRGAAV